MLLFCDTSALIKLLIDEPDSAQIHQASERAGLIAACRITWAEAMAAMARRQRDDPTSADDSVQLAAAHELHLNTEQKVLFACYDRRLNQAAQLLQLDVMP